MSVNLFVNLPAPAANGAGAAVDTSGMAPDKTIVVAGAWPITATPIVTIEINNDATPNGTWSAVGSRQGAGIIAVSVVSRWMRVLVGNYTSGQAPQVDVGATDDVPQFVNLAATAGSGTGAAVDVSALGPSKTVTVGNAFLGGLVIEVSEDGVNNWATAMSFAQPGTQTKEVAAHWMRTRRTNVPVLAPGLPLVNVGGSFGSAGGGGAASPFTPGAGAGSAIQDNGSGNVSPAASGFAHGEAASATLEGEEAFANGQFAAAGDAQAGRLVLRGSTPGAVGNEAVELKFGAADDQTIQLVDGFGYLITVDCIVKSTVAAAKVVQAYKQSWAVRRTGGVTTIADFSAQDTFGDNPAGWTLVASVGAGPDRFVLTFTTGAAATAARVVAEVKLVAVSNP